MIPFPMCNHLQVDVALLAAEAAVSAKVSFWKDFLGDMNFWKDPKKDFSEVFCLNLWLV